MTNGPIATIVGAKLHEVTKHETLEHTYKKGIGLAYSVQTAHISEFLASFYSTIASR